jgi:hypothetical protein
MGQEPNVHNVHVHILPKQLDFQRHPASELQIFLWNLVQSSSQKFGEHPHGRYRMVSLQSGALASTKYHHKEEIDLVSMYSFLISGAHIKQKTSYIVPDASTRNVSVTNTARAYLILA